MSEQEYQRAATDAPAETKEVAPVAPVSVANDVSNNIELISHRGSDYFLDYEKRRIASHRFKVSLILGLIIITFMCIVCLALSVKQYHKQYANKSCGAVLLSLSNMTAAIAAEGIASLNYVMDVDAVLYQPDRVVTRPMLQQQAYTRSILLQAAEDSKACGGSSNLFSLLNIGNVLSLQNNVLRRSITPLELMDEFRSRLLSATGALAHYVGIGVGSGVASMIWYGQLLRAVRALGTSGLGIRLAEINPSIRDKTFVSSSVCLAAVDLSTALSQVTNEFSSTMRTDYLETIEVPISIVETVLGSVEANLTDLKAGGGLSAAETLDSLMNAIQVTLQGLADAREWSKASFGTWDACMWFYPAIAVLCIVVIVMTVRDIIVAVFTAQAEVIDIYNTSRLEGSMARMEYFMDRVYHMDADGVREIVEISANYPMTTAVERNVLKLEAPVLQVLSYVNPCIMGRRLESLRSDTDSLLHESILQGNQQESLVEDGDLVGQLSLMDDGHWDAEEKSSGKELMLSGLYNSHACLLLIDFSLFCADISAERFKTIPGELKTLYKEIAELVNRFHGHVLGTSGSVLIAGWNACGGAFVDQPENSVGFLLLKLQDEVLQRKRILQCAVVSGTIPQGVVGSGTLQTFVMEGSLLRMGRYLLQIARDHDTSFVVDFSTFLRLDTRQFYKRALQKVALDSRCKGVPGNETVVFELLPTSSEVSQQNVLLWNEAFDNFHTGHIEEAKVKLRRWERLYGSTPSWNSLMMCIGERPPRTITYLYTDTEEGFDVSMVL